MSIINSIVVGKAKGKVGNVVLVNLKGQQVMKSLNTSPHNPKTANQVKSRAKMSNAVMAWQVLNLFLKHINGLRKSTESNYNAFVRLTKNSYSINVNESPFLSVNDLDGQSFGTSNFAKITTNSVSNVEVQVTFNASGIPFMTGTSCRVMSFGTDGSINGIGEKLITEAEWIAGMVIVPNSVSGARYCAAYIYNSAAGKCSDFRFSKDQE